MHKLYELKEMLCEELEQYGDRRDMTAGSLDVVDKLAHAIKNIDKIIESKEGYSERYNDGYNSARNRDGRYSRDSYRRGYSREEARRDFTDNLRRMMNSAPDEETRNGIMRMIDNMR